MKRSAFGFWLGLLAVSLLVLAPRTVGAHCDSLDGPVVGAARVALEKGDVTPVLKWVRVEDEPEIRAAFARTLVVRGKGPEAKALADTFFFETLVRLHRAGEGAPYTGLKPTGTELGPAVVGADKALETGSVESLVKLVTGDVAEGIRQRFARASGASKHMDASVEAGREYVETYVEYVHYVERIHSDAAGGAHHGDAPAAAAEHHSQ